MEENAPIRSRSKKGSSPDNLACEVFWQTEKTNSIIIETGEIGLEY